MGISYLYNFQFTKASIPVNFKNPEKLKKLTNTYKKVTLDQVYVIHYSSPHKPWDLLVNKKKKVILEWYKKYYQYYGIWLKLFKTVYKKYMKKNIDILKIK